MPLIDLTKQEVVSVLAEFEERLPNIGTTFFEPDKSIKKFDLKMLNTEAARMLRFMHIDDYLPLVRLSNISEQSAAGQAYMGKDSDKVFEIVVDQKVIKTPNLTYRVMAHEICHKFLELFDLYTGILRQYDEVQAELCTIFMGFGLLTLNGFSENTGYLNLEDFCHAFCVVYRSRGMSDEQIKDIVPSSCKNYTRNILAHMDTMQNTNLSDLLITRQKTDYELRRRLRVLQLIMENTPKIKEKHQSHDKFFRTRQTELSDGKHPILNTLLRETLAVETYKNEKLDACCSEIDKLVYNLCIATSVDIDAISDELSKDICCPSCGFVNSKTSVTSLKALKCPQCHHYFVWDGRPLTVTSPPEKKNKQSFWGKLSKKGV